MGLIPESWFLRRSTPNGQETYFHTKQICLRVERILESKERVSLDALAEELAGQKQAAAAERKLILETKYGSKTIPSTSFYTCIWPRANTKPIFWSI